MIAVDTNVLVYADRAELPQHDIALRRLTSLAEGDAAWGLPVFCIGEFVRVVSHPRLFSPPTPAVEAMAQIAALLASPSAHLLLPGPRYLRLLEQALSDSSASGNLVFDAQIAALCRESGASALLTEDRDFARFPDLRVLRLSDPAKS